MKAKAPATSLSAAAASSIARALSASNNNKQGKILVGSITTGEQFLSWRWKLAAELERVGLAECVE